MEIKIIKLESSNWPAVDQSLKRSNLIPSAINSSEINSINEDDLIIIPGVGNIKSLSSEIEKNFGVSKFRKLIIDKRIKVIGICLGFQFLCLSSEEDQSAECLGLFKYPVNTIFTPSRPSVGWHRIYTNNPLKSQEILPQLSSEFFYFTHSYGVKIENKFGYDEHVFRYDVSEKKPIVGAIIHKNFIGFQFHPEKSGEEGIRLLCNSINYLSIKNR